MAKTRVLVVLSGILCLASVFAVNQATPVLVLLGISELGPILFCFAMFEFGRYLAMRKDTDRKRARDEKIGMTILAIGMVLALSLTSSNPQRFLAAHRSLIDHVRFTFYTDAFGIDAAGQNVSRTK